MKVCMIFLSVFLIFIGGSGAPESRTYFDFPPNADPVRVGKLITENLLSRDYMLRADETGIHYAEIITADGALNFANQTRDTSMFLQLEERYACFLKTEECYLIPPGAHSRFTVALVVMGMYNWDNEQQYLDCVYTLVKDKWDKWKDPNPETGILKSARFWADDMYFTPTLETQIFKVDGDPSTIDRLTKWLTIYVDSLQLSNGLIKHTTQVPFIWGRGVGWAAAGLTNALEGIPKDHPKRQHLMDSYLKLMDALKAYQAPNGLWRQLIDYPDAWEETSGSAMFTYAMLTGIRLGWLEEETYAPVVDKAWMGLVDKLDENGEMEEVCVGTNEKTTAQEYLDRPRRTGDFHGQAPMLWAASALLLLENSRVNTRNNDWEKIRDDIVVFPNPAKDKVFFRSEDIVESNPVFELLSENGSIINSDQISASSLEARIPINVSGLADGVYIYKLKLSDRTYSGKLLIHR